jgi:hypothetical protein
MESQNRVLCEQYKPAMSIPEGSKGKYKIEHQTFPANKPIPVTNLRTSIFQGVPAMNVCFNKPVTYHFLKQKDGSVLMSDIPQEQFDFQTPLHECGGKVLVGGLGLGYVAKKLDSNPNVKEVTVIEKDKNIIDLVFPHLGTTKVKVVHDDIFKFLKKDKNKYDCAIFDIWYQDSESSLYKYVVPLRKLARGKVPEDKTFSWKEDVMRGQLNMNLQTGVAMNLDRIKKLPEKDFKETFARWDRPQYAFYKWARDKNVTPSRAQQEVEEYARTFGNPEWELKWGQYHSDI